MAQCPPLYTPLVQAKACLRLFAGLRVISGSGLGKGARYQSSYPLIRFLSEALLKFQEHRSVNFRDHIRKTFKFRMLCQHEQTLFCGFATW